MNTEATSKEAIMKACRHIVSEKGLNALSIRAVADECHIDLVGKGSLVLDQILLQEPSLSLYFGANLDEVGFGVNFEVFVELGA